MFPHFKPKYGPLIFKFLKNCIHAQIRETVFVQFNFKEILLYYTVTGERKNSGSPKKVSLYYTVTGEAKIKG